MSTHTIPDLAQHDLSPKARLSTYGRFHSRVLPRMQRYVATTGNTIDQLSELLDSRPGRRRLSDIIYRSALDRYVRRGARSNNARVLATRARNRWRKALREERSWERKLATDGQPTYDHRPATWTLYVTGNSVPVDNRPYPAILKPTARRPILASVAYLAAVRDTRFPADNGRLRLQRKTTDILVGDTGVMVDRVNKILS